MRIVRYLFVGGAAAAVDIRLFFRFARVPGFNYLLPGAGSFFIATAINYVLGVRHVFESGVRCRQAHGIILVLLVSAVGLAVNRAMLFVGVSQSRLDKPFAKVLTTRTVFPWNYNARAHFVFKGKG
jgi:putative flippase GtrA